MNPVPPYAKCVQCGKPSWNMSDIKFSNWKWKNYYCLECSPITNKDLLPEPAKSPMTQKPHPGKLLRELSSTTFKDEVSANDVRTVEPSYQRPQEEVQAEIDFLQTHSIADIPF
jgi:hypothetical protein